MVPELCAWAVAASDRPRTRIATDVSLRFFLRTKSCEFIPFLLILDTRIPVFAVCIRQPVLWAPATFERWFLSGDGALDCTRELWDTVRLSINCQMRNCKFGGMILGESETQKPTTLAKRQKAFLNFAIFWCRWEYTLT